MTTTKTEPQVTRHGVLDMQVCVPAGWSDHSIEGFADEANPAGTAAGWFIRTNPKLLAGCPVRQPCELHDGYVHVTLDC